MKVSRRFGLEVFALVVAAMMAFAPNASAAETGKITGKVLDKDGKGVAGATVVLRAPVAKGDKAKPAAAEEGKKAKADKPVAQGKTESDGAFTLADVPAGDYILNARTKDKLMAREKVTVKAGETKEVSLTLKEGKPGKKAK